VADGKYIVFYREHFERNWNTLLEVDDAIVLRQKDRFTHIAIQAYADAVSNTIEILNSLEIAMAFEAKDVINQLEEIRDWAFENSEKARSSVKKLPDA
jgi:hypothetical protein